MRNLMQLPIFFTCEKRSRYFQSISSSLRIYFQATLVHMDDLKVARAFQTSIFKVCLRWIIHYPLVVCVEADAFRCRLFQDKEID